MEDKVCCPKFDPKPWENKKLVWKEKLFAKDSVKSLFHIPINMGQIITKMWNKITESKAEVEMKDWILLSDEVSAWESDQYMPVKKEVKGMENVKVSGTFLTKVFEGPYQKAKEWHEEMWKYAKKESGKDPEKVYFYYTTCPKCAKKWGKNYVVGIAKIN
jgi:hypothetical protein